MSSIKACADRFFPSHQLHPPPTPSYSNYHSTYAHTALQLLQTTFQFSMSGNTKMQMPKFLSLPDDLRLAALINPPFITITIGGVPLVPAEVPRVAIDAFAPHLFQNRTEEVSVQSQGGQDCMAQDRTGSKKATGPQLSQVQYETQAKDASYALEGHSVHDESVAEEEYGSKTETLELPSKLDPDYVHATPADAQAALDWMLSAAKNPSIFANRSSPCWLSTLIQLHRGFLAFGINELAEELKDNIFKGLIFDGIRVSIIIGMWQSEKTSNRTDSVYLRLIAWNVQHYVLSDDTDDFYAEEKKEEPWYKDVVELLNKPENAELQAFLEKERIETTRLAGEYRIARAKEIFLRTGRPQVVSNPGNGFAIIFGDFDPFQQNMAKKRQQERKQSEAEAAKHAAPHPVPALNVRRPNESMRDFYIRIGWPLVQVRGDARVALEGGTDSRAHEDLNDMFAAQVGLVQQFRAWWMYGQRTGKKPEWLDGQLRVIRKKGIEGSPCITALGREFLEWADREAQKQ